MAAKLTRLTHKIAIQLQLVAQSCTICSCRSRWPVLKLFDTPSYVAMSLQMWRGHWQAAAASLRRHFVLRHINARNVRVIINDVSDYTHLLVIIAHIICNHLLFSLSTSFEF
jgi:hypothetical protein